MSEAKRLSWKDVREEVTRRVYDGEWAPGTLIPPEVQLAESFGCSRATVNRALQDLADTGLLERKRRAGTRVRSHPVRRASLSIPIIRETIESSGSVYGHRVLASETQPTPPAVRDEMGETASPEMIYLQTLYLKDDTPFALETRWIDAAVVPAARHEDFKRTSANEWLVRNVPFAEARFAFFAIAAGEADAPLGAAIGTALFGLDRTTYLDTRAITFVRLVYAPGFRFEMTV